MKYLKEKSYENLRGSEATNNKIVKSSVFYKKNITFKINNINYT